jgi:hypothetical protein
MGTQAFLRPIEIGSGIKFTVVGVGAVQMTVTAGVYASIFTLWEEVKTRILTHVNVTDCIVELTDDFKFRVGDTDSDTNQFALEFTNANDSTDLGMILGFVSDTISAYYHTTDYTPEYCWLPTYQSADRNRFFIDQRGLFRGAMAQDGSIAGVTTNDNLYYRSFEYAFEPVENVAIEATEDKQTFGVTTYNIEERRCWETFVDKARTVYPTEDSANPSPKGFYYVPDYSVFASTNPDDSPTVALPTSMTGSDEGGIRFNNGASPDRYVFCHLDQRGPGDPSAPLPGITYYAVDFEAHTSTPDTNFI